MSIGCGSLPRAISSKGGHPRRTLCQERSSTSRMDLRQCAACALGRVDPCTEQHFAHSAASFLSPNFSDRPTRQATRSSLITCAPTPHFCVHVTNSNRARSSWPPNARKTRAASPAHSRFFTQSQERAQATTRTPFLWPCSRLHHLSVQDETPTIDFPVTRCRKRTPLLQLSPSCRPSPRCRACHSSSL